MLYTVEILMLLVRSGDHYCWLVRFVDAINKVSLFLVIAIHCMHIYICPYMFCMQRLCVGLYICTCMDTDKDV